MYDNVVAEIPWKFMPTKELIGLVSQKNIHDVVLYIVRKEKTRAYTPTTIPTYYVGTVREESRLAYATLAYLLQSYFGVPFDANAIYVSADGKPYHKYNQYYFSFAHSNQYIACALGSSEMGVDIEDLKDIPQKIYPKIMTKPEIAERVNPTTTWVIKEAYSKLRGLGLRLSFSGHSAAAMRNECSHIIQQGADYTCALFYADAKAVVAVEVVE